MIRTELRKWDKYENKSEWKEFINSLSKEDYSIYQSYRGHRGNIVKVENKMKKTGMRKADKFFIASVD